MRVLRALWMWVRGRRSVPDAAVEVFTADRGTLAVPVAFAIATGVEMVVLHLLVPWPWLQIVLAVLSVWSLLMLFGFLAVHRTHPHYITEDRLVLRQFGSVVASIDLDEVEHVSRTSRYAETAPVIVDGRLFLPNSDGTTVDVTVARPIPVRLPALLPGHRTTESVTAVGACPSTNRSSSLNG
ncbi:hypothetical protein [Prescottella subtropica]|uniref:hypothetical protein n=1 Tax=Prescottella subtropica TaxID=2545757 RepID=UPI0010F50C8D|nr:hypothetical protein [Prescottella subtropica]